jgi:hypothetical protein
MGAKMQRREISDTFVRHWLLWVLVFWLGGAAYLLHDRWGMIQAFALSDTDDNMRMMQVRALLAGQDWFDLRQYRLDPPVGADIHWSRLVDLPIAALIILFKPLFGGATAERIATAIAPMIPMLVALAATAVSARRLIAPKSIAVALLFLFLAHSARTMWSPLRIDHHGWQLASLSLVVMGLSDPRRVRSGMVIGLATALSLTIGLEMLIYLAAAGAVLGLFWLRSSEEGPRLVAYGASLAGGSALGYLLFASYANRAPVCDALSPVWLSTMAVAGALCVVLGRLSPVSPVRRLVLAVVGGAALGLAFVWAWPHCLGRLEGISPEAQRLWLDQVREARPIYKQSATTMVAFLTLPLIGLAGYALQLCRHRRDPALLLRWAAIALLAVLSVCLLLWQTRAGPAAQFLSVLGATALAWVLVGAILRSRFMLVRVFGAAAAVLIVSGLGIQVAAGHWLKEERPSEGRKKINRANRLCPTLVALRPVALQPKGTVLTFVDLSPRLITVTHHDAVAGPYHRNDAAIVDVMRAFRGTAAEAEQMIRHRRIDYVLICPNMSEATNYQAGAPEGFYAQLLRNRVPAWLSPVQLPSNSPYRMWRVVRG